MEIEFIEVNRVVEDPDQPRKHYDTENLQGLADSIKQHGVLQPITVFPLSNVNMYKIVTGERRWRASQMVGLTEIPCIVRDVNPDEIMTQQLIENLQREDLQPLEKAQALTHVKDRFGATNRELASRLGISERMVGHLLDLMELPREIGEQIVSSPNRPAAGQLTEKHARFLKQLNENPDLQSAVVEKIQNEKITSDQTGKLVKALRNRPEQSEEILSSPTSHLDDFFRDLEPVKENEMDQGASSSGVSPDAQAILHFLSIIDAISVMNLSPTQIRQLQDALTSLKQRVDGLLRECRLEQGESA
jgi:ParB family chromosome partitioning protein